MGQVGIVRRSAAYFRDYAIESGDSLIGICLRFGHRDWQAVYDHAENAAFRARYPDPDQIDFINPVNLFIPLVGATSGGTRRRGAPIGDYIIARFFDVTRNPLQYLKLRQIAPGAPHAGVNATTNASGDIIIANPAAGDWHIGSAEYELMPEAAATQNYPVKELVTIPNAGGLPEITTDVALVRNAVTRITARRAFVLRCPMCGISFKTVEPPSGMTNLCPNDGFDLTSIETAIVANPISFTSPATGQNPATTPTNLLCRGTQTLTTAHGMVSVYRDETRFVLPNQGNYTLWGKLLGDIPKTAQIIGRATWGAGPPITTGRSYDFQATAINASPAYASFGIPSNETNALDAVFKWMTIHHTTNKAMNSYVTATELQIFDQTEGKDGDPYADVSYHFIIDANGSIYEGRPLGIKGAHVEKFNGGNVGIVFAGDFESRKENRPIPFQPDTPTAAALNAFYKLVDVLAARFNIRSVWTHKMRAPQAGLAADYTECPGDNLEIYVEGPLRSKFSGPPP
jgi:hypothetical protein